MISTVGAIFLLLVVAGLIFRPGLLPWCLSAGVCFPGSAGIIIADQNIQVFYMVAIAMLGAAVARVRTRSVFGADLRARPGLRPLTAYLVWTLLVTATAPFIFAGIHVLNPRDGIDEGIANPASLVYQVSNFAQSGYLLFGVAIVVCLGTMRSLSSWIPVSGLAIGTILSSLRYAMPEGLAVELFDSSPNVSISGETLRLRGIFPEPSSFGGFEVTAAVFFVMAASRTQGWRRYVCLGLGLWALVNAVLSGSGTALIGGLLILGVIAVQAGYRAVVGVSRISIPALVGWILAVPVLIVIGPALYAAANGVVGDKVDSSSYANRSAADLFSINLTAETYGIGVGVGANRPSSFLAMILSSSGVLGFLLFTAAFIAITWTALRSHAYQPTAWALVALMCSKVVAGPDLSDPLMWFLLAICARGAWTARTEGPKLGARTIAATPAQLPLARLGSSVPA